VESVHYAVAITIEEQCVLRNVSREVSARFADLRVMPHVEPGAAEDVAALAVKHLLVHECPLVDEEMGVFEVHMNV
jgi:hypothetical protein